MLVGFDVAEIGQVILNLLSNVIKASFFSEAIKVSITDNSTVSNAVLAFEIPVSRSES
jgi:signal transduction histidine kinase